MIDNVINQSQETHLVELKKKCDEFPHPYNGMVFGMWCEEYGFPKTSCPFDGSKNHPLYIWFMEGWQANRDAKIMSGKIRSEEIAKQKAAKLKKK